MPRKQHITNWGKYPVVESLVTELEHANDITSFITQQTQLIPRGNGRCYGDASLGEHVFSTLQHNKILQFDAAHGILQCQAGTLLSEILEVVVAKGFFLSVTPGTKFITVGGAIAADIHGKNHHKNGNFSEFVLAFDLLMADGTVRTCSKTENEELFWLTCGGMGLTGIVLNATLQLQPIETAYIQQSSIKTRNLEELIELFETSDQWNNSVAWIDCLSKGNEKGRAIFTGGNFATREALGNEKGDPLSIRNKSNKNVPGLFPGFLLNTLSVKAFNLLYYNKQQKHISESFVDYNAFFYPLDAIHNWNNIYGKAGFTQYQFVLPRAESKAGLEKIIDKIADSGKGSFLTVLKLLGKSNPNAVMSFPMEGYTLALDFKIQKGVFELLNDLDRVVLEHGGRLYLAKDARMQPHMMDAYPKLQYFKERIKALNGSTFQSVQSNRLKLT